MVRVTPDQSVSQTPRHCGPAFYTAGSDGQDIAPCSARYAQGCSDDRAAAANAAALDSGRYYLIDKRIRDSEHPVLLDSGYGIYLALAMAKGLVAMDHAALHMLKFKSSIGEQKLCISDDRLDRLIGASRSRQPLSAPTARSLADWVYRLEHSARETVPHRSKRFLQAARRAISNVLDRNADKEIGEWELLSCDDGSSDATVYEALCLRVHEQPLRMKPDAIFRHTQSGVLAIAEYKIPSPMVRVPAAGWPNLAAQLWAYSLADDWVDNVNVLLIGALFAWNGVEAKLSAALPRTTKMDKELFTACATLFLKAGGTINSTHVANRHVAALLRNSRC